MNSVSPPTVHPSGDRAVVAVTRPDIGANEYVGQLWSVPLDPGSGPGRLTRGFHDSAPQYSPNGSLLAFIRNQPAAPGQLHVMSASGGEPIQVTDAILGVSHFRWSPDGTRFAFVARAPEKGRYGTVEHLGAEAESPRRITTERYTANGLGYTNDRRSQVFLVDVPDVTAEPIIQPVPTPGGAAEAVPIVAEATQITDGDFDNGNISFSPDGRTLAVVSARHEGRDRDLRTSVILIDVVVSAGDPQASINRQIDVSAEFGDWSVIDVEYSGDGALFFLAQEDGPSGRDFVARNAALYLIEHAGARPEQLTDAESVNLGEIGGVITPLASGDVLVQNGVRGTLQLVRVGRDGSLEQLTRQQVEITGVGCAGKRIVVSYADASTVGDVAVLQSTELRGNAELFTLTDFSAALREAGIVKPIEIEVTGRDGYPVHGWVVLPAGEGPHPVLLIIHGGPFTQYGVHIFDEAQVYADAGYAVVMCNPRGSSGYGQAHGRAVRQAMGTSDLHDVMDFLDGAIAEHQSLDADRVGIMGGSYGGYLTAWTIAHEHRFAAAIVERGFLDPETFAGTSDIGSYFGDEYTGTDPELRRSQSPQAVVHQVRMPTLVLHSEQDLRCPLSQAERYYAALKRQGVETELVIFPGEDHELSRSGRPRHRVERFDVILGWWSRYLPLSPMR